MRERITRALETVHGSFVFAQQDQDTGLCYVVCSGCESTSGDVYPSRYPAMAAAEEHSYRTDH